MTTSPPEWTRQTLKSFTDAAAEATAKIIGDFKRETRRELELRDAQFAARTAALDYRLASVADLERRLTERLATLRDGRDGVDGVPLTLDDVGPAIADYVDHVLAGWERPKDGKSVTVEDIEPVLRDLVSEAVARLQRERQASPARHWPAPSGWPRGDRPIIDIEATPPLTDRITDAVRLLSAPVAQGGLGKHADAPILSGPAGDSFGDFPRA